MLLPPGEHCWGGQIRWAPVSSSKMRLLLGHWTYFVLRTRKGSHFIYKPTHIHLGDFGGDWGVYWSTCKAGPNSEHNGAQSQEQGAGRWGGAGTDSPVVVTAYCVLRTENIFVCWCCVGSDRAAGVGVSLGSSTAYESYPRVTAATVVFC